MPFSNYRIALLVAATVLATSACGGNNAVPSYASGPSNPALRIADAGAGVVPEDTTSILKKLKKNVTIGSTVDPKNGDTGPRAISLVPTTFVLQKGQLLVCNFDDAAGTAGQGTTIEVLDPKPGSKPTTFVQSSKIEGCDGDAITTGDQVYGTGMTSNLMAWINQSGAVKKTYGSPIATPLANGDAPPLNKLYNPEFIFTGDSNAGSIVSLMLGAYSRKILEVATGFAVNKGTGWGALGPTGLSYIGGRTNTLYVVDGANNTVVAFFNASALLLKDEIVVQPGGKTFKCKFPKQTCGRLVYSGAPLDAPVASTLLPNGNLVVANTKGGNKLVELTPTGQVLATKSIDFSPAAHVFGLCAIGTNDNNTAILFTDTKTNTIQELEQ